MGAPRNDVYQTGPGGGIYASLIAPHTPTWLASAPVGQWSQIANTTAPSQLKDYSGVAWRIDSTHAEVLSALAGGHQGNYLINEVRSIDLLADTPVWVQRRASSDSSTYDTTGNGSAYYADGTPAPRHTYWDCLWVPERSRYIIGGRFWGSSAVDKNRCDGFDPIANSWDAAGTYANNPGGLFRGVRDPNSGIWYCGGSAPYKWNPSTDTWASWPISGQAINRGQMAWDSARSHIFELSTGDNFGAGSATVNAAKITTAGVSTAITFNASSAYTDFVNNGSNFLTTALVYDNVLDCYYFYNGGAEGTQKVYKITPNSGATWDMSLMTVTGVTPNSSYAAGGVMNKFALIPALRTLILIVPNDNVYFLRLA